MLTRRQKGRTIYGGGKLDMTKTSVRLGTLADESAVFALLPALVEAELVAGTPIKQSSAARAVYRDLVTSARGSVIVFEVDGEVLGLKNSSFTTRLAGPALEWRC
jgi:hypothetical protein